MAKCCCVKSRAKESPDDAEQGEQNDQVPPMDERPSALSFPAEIPVNKPYKSAPRPLRIGTMGDQPSRSSGSLPSPTTETSARLSLGSPRSPTSRLSSEDGELRESPGKSKRMSRFPTLFKSKSKISLGSHRVISRSLTENLAEAAPDVIHGLTDANKETYKEALLRLAETPAWNTAYENKNPPAKILYKMEPGNRVGWLFVAMRLPAGIVQILAPTLEVDTWTKWHPYCTKHAMAGSASTWAFQSHFEQSMAFGAFKSDQNTRTQRWVNETQGFFLQHITTVNAGEEGYVAPRLNRDKLEADVLTASPSPNETLMLQRIRIEMPITIPNFMQKFVFATAAPKMLKQLISNAALADNPKHPYKRLIEEDRLGIYAFLQPLAIAESPKPEDIIECTMSFLTGERLSKGGVTGSTALSKAGSPESKKKKRSSKLTPNFSPKKSKERFTSRMFSRKSMAQKSTSQGLDVETRQ